MSHLSVCVCVTFYCFYSSERYFISLSQHCLPKDPEKINQCFALFTVSWFAWIWVSCLCRNRYLVCAGVF